MGVRAVGIAGGSGAGKTTLARRVVEQLGAEQVTLLAVDRYYRGLGGRSPEQVNFDHPDALDAELLARHVAALKRGERVHAPTYDFERHERIGAGEPLEPRPLLVVEGVLLFALDPVRDLLDLRIYVDAPRSVRLRRRLRRDRLERGRSFAGVLRQYRASVRPMHARFVEPSRCFAHAVIPHGAGYEREVERLLAVVAPRI